MYIQKDDIIFIGWLPMLIMKYKISNSEKI
jgi:hypothetical protein